MEDKTLGLRKIFGYIALIVILYYAGKTLPRDIYESFGKYAFYGFFVLVGGNAIEYLKTIVGNLKK